MSVRGARCFRQPHAVVISVTCSGVVANCGTDVDGEACPIVAVFVVSLHGCEGELGRVAVYHGEDCVVCFIVAFVVLCCFDACVHDSGVSSAALEYVLDVCYPVSAATSLASDEF